MSPRDQLLQEIERSRMRIRTDAHALADEFNLVRKAEVVLRKNPLRWVAGALATGFILSGGPRFLFPKKSADSSRQHLQQKGKLLSPTPNSAVAPPRGTGALLGAILGFLRAAFPLVKPVLMAYATKKMAELAAGAAKK